VDAARYNGEAGGSRVFSANLAKRAFRCFKCGAAGNQLDLCAKAVKKPLHEAALELCARLNREVPWLQKRTEKRNYGRAVRLPSKAK
jgi:DNA primase